MLSFNFDLLIIVIILISIIKGYNRGLYRQLASTVSILVPVIFLQIWGNAIYILVHNNTLFISLTTFIYGILKLVANVDLQYVQTLLLYSLIFIILSLLIKIVFKVFGPSKRDNLINVLSNTSKGLGSVFGLIAAYFIIVIGFTFIKPITNIDEDKPITSIIIKTNSILNDDFNIVLSEEE